MRRRLTAALLASLTLIGTACANDAGDGTEQDEQQQEQQQDDGGY